MNDIKGLNVKKLSIFLIALEALFFALSIACIVHVYIYHKRVDKITDDYILIQSDIYNLQSASDLLSAKSRQYVMTGEMSFAYEYFKEVNETRRRENAVENINEKVSDIGYGATEPIEEALKKSNSLMQREVHAMALIESIDDSMAVDYVPEEIASYELADDEKKLSIEQKRERAYSLVFGDGYSFEKLSIRESVDAATDNLLGEIGDYKAICSSRYKVSFTFMVVFFVASATTFIAIAFSLFGFVLNPLAVSIAAIQEEKLIPMSRSYELNYLAVTYNGVYEDNASTRLKLKDKAERDELTGLLNRSAFNDLVDFYKDAHEKLAFLIIDVDNFKTVNDNYGHAIGDLALKKVAKLLEECFRSNDFPIRYGGDEFAVIMTELTEEQKGVIERKLQYLNNTLQIEADDEIPKLSVSVGVAFSEHGFADGLFERADAALYKTKKNGRCGYTFG
ncbi:MAG: GGDEF domain-containing protein [Lachnospiraceae bacterium]|nr:GGDEF domain-containing protein [Lachnospiraceae bacterium]